MGDWLREVKGLRRTNCSYRPSWGVEYSTGNTAGAVVVTVYGARWVLGRWGENFTGYMTV